MSRLDFETLFQIVNTPLLVLDPDLRVVAVNNAYISATGIQKKDTIGHYVFDVFPENPENPTATGASALKSSLLKVLETQHSDEMPVVQYDIPIRDSAPHEFSIRFWKPINTPIFDSSGKLTHILHRAEDVTEFIKTQNLTLTMEVGLHDLAALKMAQEALRASQFELQKIVDLTPVTIAVFKGAEHRYAITNPAQERLVGKPLQGLSLNEAYSKEERQDLEGTLDRIYRTGEPFFGNELAYNFVGEDGIKRERWLNLSFEAIPALDGTISGILGVGQDVTDQVLAREKLQRALNEQKQTELKLKQAKDEAERANQLKSAFLANMSHEIRTPLGAILGFSSLLKDRNLSPEEREHYVDTILRNGDSLTRIIDDILDLAKVEAGKLDVENVPFSLRALMIDAIDLFRDKTKEKKISLALEIDQAVPTAISSDPTRLRQILVNLIGNAVKFTDQGGIRVQVRSKTIDDGRAEIAIEVHDTGIGIAPEQKARLFEPFTQADNSTTRRFGGTGLGLALSQRLSRAISGEIAISDFKEGQGTTFILTFKTQLANIEKLNFTTNELPRNTQSLKGISILVVDDSPDNQFLITRLLTRHGASVDTASDGLDGYHKALLQSFDVILMDIQMPNMDGYQAKQALDKAGYERPVIALTAHAMSDERAKTSTAGFAGHLTKPLIASQLLQTVATLGRGLNNPG